MTISFSNLGINANPDLANGDDLSAYSNSSWTPPSSGLIRLEVWSRQGDGPNTPTVSGNGLTWTEIATVAVSTVHRLTLFGADAIGSTTGATTIDFAGQTQIWCKAIFSLAEGVDLSGGVAAAFVQVATNSGVNIDNLSIALSAAGAADNRPIAVFMHAWNEDTSPRTNWTELDDLTGGFNITGQIQSQYRDDAFETTASASWATSISAAGIAAELKAEAAGGGDPEGPMVGGKLVGGGLLIKGRLVG